MFRKRLAFAVLTLTTLAAAIITGSPALAHDGGYGGGYSRGGYGGGYHRGDDCYRPRRSYRTYSSPRYYSRSRYDDYGHDYRPRYRSYRTSSSSLRYRCGCGDRFGSAYWLDYHRDHGGCRH